MLSIEKCRELIEDGDKYSDEEIKKIRDTLNSFAELALESYFTKKQKENRTKK